MRVYVNLFNMLEIKKIKFKNKKYKNNIKIKKR
jgi:hypothetical protein